MIYVDIMISINNMNDKTVYFKYFYSLHTENNEFILYNIPKQYVFCESNILEVDNINVNYPCILIFFI